MIVAGKCPPEPDGLAAAADRGFDAVELYLEKQHLDTFDQTLDAIRDATVDVVSMHTPHVQLDNMDYMLQADRLAQELDAFLVVHSQYIQHVHIPELEQLSFSSVYGYENNPGASKDHLENSILDHDHQLVFDTAHFFIAHPHAYDMMGTLLDDYGKNIPVIHLNDATLLEDGLAFGDGAMDMGRVIAEIMDSTFDGILVLEVMPEHQEAARKQVERYR